MLRKLLLSLLGAASMGAGLGCGPHPAHMHAARHAGANVGLAVSGRGEARAAPDIARATVGIEIRAESAEQATAQANERMAAVLAAIKGVGVAESDLRTNNFSINFERDFTPEPVPVEPAPPTKSRATTAAAPAPTPATPRGSYRASNTVEVTVREIGRVSEVLSAATTAGANNVWGVQFELSDREPLRAQARAQAVERAKQSAQQLAQLTGVKLGRIRAIEDLSDGAASPVAYAEMRMQASNSVPVQQGELTLQHEVRLTYSLDDD